MAAELETCSTNAITMTHDSRDGRRRRGPGRRGSLRQPPDIHPPVEAPGDGKTREELLESLKVTLEEALEFNRQEAIRAAAADYTEEIVTI